MSQPGRRRILVAVEPIVVEGALAALLGEGDRAEVVQFHRAHHAEMAGPYDAAIVTDGLPHGTQPKVLVTLPDTKSGDGTARVTIGGRSWSISVSTLHDVDLLLADQFPAEMSVDPGRR